MKIETSRARRATSAGQARTDEIRNEGKWIMDKIVYIDPSRLGEVITQLADFVNAQQFEKIESLYVTIDDSGLKIAANHSWWSSPVGEVVAPIV